MRPIIETVQPAPPRAANPHTLDPKTSTPRPHRFPFALTRAGFVWLGVTGFVYAATYNSGVNLLYFAFGLMVGALAVSMAVASWSLGRIDFRRTFSEHIIAGEPADIEYRFTSAKRYWPTMALHFRELNADLAEVPRGFILHLPSGTRAEPVKITTRVVARRRGNVKLDAVEISTTFPFGFIRRTRRVHVPQHMIVYPRIGLLNRHLALEYRESVESGAMTSNRRGGNDEFYGVREYRPGDNVRAIHWRSSARTGQVMIREMAANAPPQLIVVLNVRTWRQRGESLEQVERAIELAATLVCYGFFENFAVGLAIAGLAEGALPPAPHMGRDTRSGLLRQLAMIHPQDIRPEVGIDFPNRIAGRAEWVVVTLHGDDPTRDLLAPGSPATMGIPGGGGGGGGSSHRTLLALDAPDAKSWVHFLSPEETLRILRDRGSASGGRVENPPEGTHG